MKKKMLILIVFLMLFGSCNSNKEISPELSEGRSIQSPVPSSTSTPVPPTPTNTPTIIPTPEPYVSLTSSESRLNITLGGKEIQIDLVLQEDLDFDYLEINAMDTEDYILFEIVDPQGAYLPYIGLITKTQTESLSVEVVLPPKDLYAVSYGPYEILPGDLNLELVAETSLDELSDQIGKLKETGSISILFPHYGEGVIYPDLEIYKVSHTNSLYLILPSETQIWEVPVSLIPIAFQKDYGDQILVAIEEIILLFGFNIDTMEVLPGVTYEQWMTEGQGAYEISQNPPALPPSVKIRAAHDKYVYISSSQPMTVYFTWSAYTSQQVQDYINNVNASIDLNNQVYTGRFGPIFTEGSYTKSTWTAYIPGLTPGVYEMKIVWVLSKAVSDGQGTYGPAVYDNKITIYVE